MLLLKLMGVMLHEKMLVDYVDIYILSLGVMDATLHSGVKLTMTMSITGIDVVVGRGGIRRGRTLMNFP